MWDLIVSVTDHCLSFNFTASAFRKLPSIYVFSYFPFGFEDRMWDLIVSVPNHCLSFYFGYNSPVVSLKCGHLREDNSRSRLHDL